eukprot:Skav232234  [mRNA]  locus=scaffold4367:134627:147445:- [translate_table: standard]
MVPYSRYTKSLAPGALLSLLQLEDSHFYRFCADDLSDFYYTFKVPRARARRNCIGMKFYPSEVQDLSCYDPAVPGPFFPSLATLAMGDGHAVEIAQGSHYALLQLEGGSMLPSETLEYRKAVPRGKFVELLAIDDHIGIQKVNAFELKHQLPARDTQVFEQSNAAYSKVGLKAHPGKQKRFQTLGTILGADFDGIKGRVSAPRSRLHLLMWISALVARRGTCTKQLMASLLGCWIHVILFRRPLLSLIDSLFKFGDKAAPTEVVCLSNHDRHELISLCLLGTCSQADLRVVTTPKIFALDASPWGAGIVVADSHPTAVAELWRHSEQRGFHTNLLGPAAATLKGLGIDPEQEFLYGVDDHPGVSHEVPPLKLAPSLQEGILYDCVELFRGSGNWSTCHQHHGLVVHDGFEVTGNRLFFKDLSDNQTFREVISLALRRVVREWHAGPPCLTFGTLRRPRLRSKLIPWGFNPTDPLTASHNSLARRTAMLGCIVVLSGAYFRCEQSGSSVMFRMHLFRVLVMLGCVVTRVASCSFGSAFNKPYQWLHNKGWLTNLDGVCRCKWKGKHFKVEGTFTRASVAEFNSRCQPDALSVYGRLPQPGEAVSSFSAQYPKSMMNRMAQGSVAAKVEGNPVIPHQARVLSFARVGLIGDPLDHLGPGLDETTDRRDWFEDPEWIGELADSLPFKTLFKYHFKHRAHINVLENQVYSSWIRHCAKQHRNSRVLGLLDSRVTLGATAKGRSSSFAITKVLKRNIPYIIGSNLYPGGLHVYSSKNRADAPSRDREVEPPSKALPKWYDDLVGGDFRRFDLVCQTAQIPKLAARWLRLLLLLGGDIEPNPGPPPHHRGELDMAAGFSKPTATRMAKCFSAFCTWIVSELSLDPDRVFLQSDATALALRAYGLHLYRTGMPRYLLVYAITAVQDIYPQFRSHLGAAWQVDKKWQQAEPGHCRPVLSLPLLQAILSVGLLWNWPRWVGVTLLGFAGMLHPAEFISLRRKDLMLPADTGFITEAIYVHLRNPKTSRFARQQHVKISDPDVIRFVVHFFGPFSLEEKLFGATMYSYRSQWNAIMTKLNVPCKQQLRGITPGSLRGSGATMLYLQTEDIPMICWRGRWARLRTLEFYLQEVAAQVMMNSLPTQSQILVNKLSSACVMGLPVLQAPGEAERLCAQLALSGLAKAAATEAANDFDALAFGAPKVLRNLHHGSASPQLPLVQVPEDWNFSGARTCFQPMDLGFVKPGDLKDTFEQRHPATPRPAIATCSRASLTGAAGPATGHDLDMAGPPQGFFQVNYLEGPAMDDLKRPASTGGSGSCAARSRSDRQPKKQFGTRPPATPQKSSGNPLKEAFCKGKRKVVEEATPIAKRRRRAVAALQDRFGQDLLLPAETPLAELERLVEDVEEMESQASQCTTLPGSSLFRCLSLDEERPKRKADFQLQNPAHILQTDLENFKVTWPVTFVVRQDEGERIQC